MQGFSVFLCLGAWCCLWRRTKRKRGFARTPRAPAGRSLHPCLNIKERKGNSMISVEEALERILAGIGPLGAVEVALSEVVGQVLARDVVAQDDIPPFANSAMDGFALLSKDSQLREGRPPRLRVTGGVAAG